MSDVDKHLAAAAAAAKGLEARIAQLEAKLTHTRLEREEIARECARLKVLVRQKKKRLTADSLRDRHVALKTDLHRLRSDAQLAGDTNLLRKIQGLDQPANPYIERERLLDQREQALEEREQQTRRFRRPWLNADA